MAGVIGYDSLTGQSNTSFTSSTTHRALVGASYTYTAVADDVITEIGFRSGSLVGDGSGVEIGVYDITSGIAGAPLLTTEIIDSIAADSRNAVTVSPVALTSGNTYCVAMRTGSATAVTIKNTYESDATKTSSLTGASPLAGTYTASGNHGNRPSIFATVTTAPSSDSNPITLEADTDKLSIRAMTSGADIAVTAVGSVFDTTIITVEDNMVAEIETQVAMPSGGFADFTLLATGVYGWSYSGGAVDEDFTFDVQYYSPANEQWSEATISVTALVANAAPTGQPAVSGTATEDQTLTASIGTLADADGVASIAYQWQRDGVNISGATSSTLVLTQTDVGAVIRVGAAITDNDSNVETVIYSAATSSVANINDDPAGTPAITGTVTQGQTLTATAGTLADEDVLGSFSYQWQRDQVNIGGATSATYQLTQADVGANIRVGISYTDGQGTSEGPVYSAETSAVANVNDAATGIPVISGTKNVGQTLSASIGSIADIDGVGSLTYQWQRGQVNISGATASSYLLDGADEGALIRVGVSFTDALGGSEGPLYSAETTAIQAAINNAATGVPTITGTATENQTLTAVTSAIADADGLGTFSYQWLRDGSNISGATSSTLTLGDSDVGTQVSVRVSFTDGEGNAEAVTSSQTASVLNVNDAPSGVPAITGTATEGQTLTAVTSGITDNDGLGAFSYQWLRDTIAILGATSSTYLLADADVDSLISVRVTYTDGNGTAEGPLTSAQTAAVINLNTTPTGSVTIDNTTPQEEDTLTASNNLADADGIGAINYQWERAGVDILGETNSTYDVVAGDIGSTISVTASYTDAHGTLETVTSSATSAVAALNRAPVIGGSEYKAAIVGSSFQAVFTITENDGATPVFGGADSALFDFALLTGNNYGMTFKVAPVEGDIGTSYAVSITVNDTVNPATVKNINVLVVAAITAGGSYKGPIQSAMSEELFPSVFS